MLMIFALKDMMLGTAVILPRFWLFWTRERQKNTAREQETKTEKNKNHNQVEAYILDSSWTSKTDRRPTTTDSLMCPQRLYLRPSTPITMYPMYVWIKIFEHFLKESGGRRVLSGWVRHNCGEASIHYETRWVILPFWSVLRIRDVYPGSQIRLFPSRIQEWQNYASKLSYCTFANPSQNIIFC
jgi:hypothetical protein